MITWIDIIGYIASVFVAATFYMKTMIPLRIFGLCSNVFFIMYAAFGGLLPVLILHVVLFPLNILRLYQILELTKSIKEAKTNEFPVEFLMPYMKKKNYQKGDVLFRKCDPADKLYYIVEGELYLEEMSKSAGKGEVIGEIGIFSPFKERTASAICKTDLIVYEIVEDEIIRLYFQNPKFGFHIIKLIIKRYISNYICKNEDCES